MYQTIKDQENRDKCSGDNYKNKYHKYFARMTETSWKGEKQTLDCLEKIMDKEKDYLVVKGSIQSGKSSLMIYYSAWNADNSDDNIVIMLRNQTTDIKSLSNKFRKFKKEKNIKNLEIIPFTDYYNTFDIEDVVDKFNETRKIFIILGNSEQLKKLNIIEGIKPFKMLIDELDLNEKEETTEFYKQFNRLENSGKITKILGVTGTALPIFFKRIRTLSKDQVICLESALNYKGIHNITFTEIDIKDNNIIEKTFLKLLKSNFAFFDKDGNKHPCIVLVKDERVKANQMQLMNNLHENDDIKKNYVVIVYNGDGISFKMPGNKEVVIPKNASINDALQKIKDLKDESIKYIAIISGDLASRGLSFVSNDYGWHLSHMILCARDCSTGSTLIQNNRLAGCYSDDIPLEMFTSPEIQKEMFAYDTLQERCVERCEDPLIDSEKLDACLSKMKLDEKCVVRRPIDLKVKIKYDTISNYDKIVCGEKIDSNTIEEAVEIVTKNYGEKPRVYVKEICSTEIFNKENCNKIKQQMKDKGYKTFRVIDNKRICVLKNPEFSTKTYTNVDVMICNKNNTICYYIKEKQELSYNDLFLFQTPKGIFLARNTGNKEELEKSFKKLYNLHL